MSRATLSIIVFGVYLGVLGIVLVIAPNPAIGLAGLPPTDEVWLRIAGFLAAAIGYYYLQAARNDGLGRSTGQARLRARRPRRERPIRA